MPIYQAQCKVCNQVGEYYQTVRNCHETPTCCGVQMQKVILTPPMGWVEHIAYTSPIDGRPITTKQQRIEDLRRNNARPWEGMEQETKVAQQRVKDEEKRQDQKLEEVAVATYNQLSPEKRKALESA